jgi:hypothetical protein
VEVPLIRRNIRGHVFKFRAILDTNLSLWNACLLASEMTNNELVGTTDKTAHGGKLLVLENGDEDIEAQVKKISRLHNSFVMIRNVTYAAICDKMQKATPSPGGSKIIDAHVPMIWDTCMYLRKEDEKCRYKWGVEGKCN